MKPFGEISITSQPEEQPKTLPAIEGDIANLFSKLPKGIDSELAELFSELPPNIAEKIKSRLFQRGKKTSKIEEEFDKADKEDRADDRTYNREDLLEFDEVGLEIGLKCNMREAFSRYLKSEVIKCQNYEEFRALLLPFIDRIWSSRGKKEIDTPEQGGILEIEERCDKFCAELRSLETKLESLKEKVGNRKRIPNALNAELTETESRVAEMKQNRFSMDFERMDVRGKRHELRRASNKFKTSVYFAEFFSAEDYAILLLEELEEEAVYITKLHKLTDSRMASFTATFFEEWSKIHSGELPLVSNKHRKTADKQAVLIERFAERLESYLRHKSSDSASQNSWDSIANEIPVVLRILQKI